jgi:cystathionine beta-lyase
MKYNFDEIIERRGTDSVKWNTGMIFNEPEALPLWVADMDFRAPQPVVDALVERAVHGVFGYISRSDSFCQAIIDWAGRRHGWRIEQPWIVTSPGVVPALSLAVQALTLPGDKVIIQPPVYMPFLSIVPDNGRQLLLNPLKVENGRYEMDYAGLEQKMQDRRARMLILCNPHNPVGRVWHEDELRRLGDLCLKYKILLLSDEIHADVVFPGHRHIPIASLSPEFGANAITFMAPSKTFNIAGLTSSFAVISEPRLREQFTLFQNNLHISANNIFGVRALEAAYTCGEEWLDQLLEYLEGNLDFMLDFLRRRIPRLKAHKPEGTYLVWLDCRALGLPQQDLCGFFARKAKVGLNDGATFGTGGEGFMRVNVACPRATLRQALEQIEQAVNGV